MHDVSQVTLCLEHHMLPAGGGLNDQKQPIYEMLMLITSETAKKLKKKYKEMESKMRTKPW